MEKTTLAIAKITLALCIFCAVSFGQNPKVAVYVSETSGYDSEVKSALKNATVNVLVRGGRYEVVERSGVIDEELGRQASGAVDDDQMVAFGRQAGARYICVSDIIELGRYNVKAEYENYRDHNGTSRQRKIREAYSVHPHQVSARIIDVETAQLVGLGVIDKDIQNGAAMSAAITEAVEKMLETITVQTASNLPKRAVYIQGGSRNNQSNNALYTYTLEALFTRSRYNGDFTVVERSDAFTSQIDREQGKQHSGSVSDGEISRMGKQYGISEICIASIENAMGTYNISARLVNVERASVVNASQLRHLPESGRLSYLRDLAIDMVEDMIPRQMSAAEIEEEKLREAQKEEENRRIKAQKEEEARTASMAGVAIGGGVDLNINEIDPNYFKDLGGRFNLSAEFYKQNSKFFRYGANLDLGGLGVNRDEVRRTHPNVFIDSIGTFNIKINAFARLYPVDFLFVSGGAGYAWYNIYSKGNKPGKTEVEDIDVVKISTPIFPVGGGIVLGPGGNGIVIEALYNIVPFSGRTAAYMSINAGFKVSFFRTTPETTPEKREVKQKI